MGIGRALPFLPRGRPANPVSRSANRVDELFLVRKIDLFAQIVYVDIHKIAVGLKLKAPGFPQEVMPAHRLTRMAHEQEQEIKFLGAEFDLALAAMNLA